MLFTTANASTSTVFYLATGILPFSCNTSLPFLLCLMVKVFVLEWCWSGVGVVLAWWGLEVMLLLTKDCLAISAQKVMRKLLGTCTSRGWHYCAHAY